MSLGGVGVIHCHTILRCGGCSPLKKKINPAASNLGYSFGSAAMLEIVLLAILSRYLLCCLDSHHGTNPFGFENALRIRAYISASGVFVESISNAGMHDSFG